MKQFENNDIEIYEFEGEGYEPTMNYGEWRVALMNYSENLAKLTKYERHLLTDEVFVLLEGKSTLIVGESKTEYKMEKFKIYNIKRGVWHGTVMSADAKLLIVENHNTSAENSEKVFYETPIEVEL
jgi:ureidoglycolate hydrolase